MADGLRSAIEYDKTYFDKLTASLLTLMEKPTSGPVGKLLSPDYDNPNDTRPILDWMNVIREGGIVYIGLDVLSDSGVASAVGNSMFADLTSLAGRLYKHGITYGLPGSKKTIRRAISVHANQITDWKKQLLNSAPDVFGKGAKKAEDAAETTQDLYAKIGQLTMENDFLERGPERIHGPRGKNGRSEGSTAGDPPVRVAGSAPLDVLSCA